MAKENCKRSNLRSHALVALFKSIASALLLCSLSACADVYRWQDDNGNSHYTDRHHDNSAKLAIKPSYGYVKVANVYDGDTVRLEDGRKIRLLGINTPEVKHRNQGNEAGGEVAKRWLADKLLNKKVRLTADVEQTDKYHRTLAHLFTETNEHINLALVEQGFAVVTIYPPNLLYAEALVAAGQRAEQAKRGIWQQAEYAIIPMAALTENGHSGWLRLMGKVETIRSSRKYVYLVFSKLVEARIEKKWLPLFPDVNSYRGRNLEIRGWLNKNRGGWSLLLRHPSAVKVY